MFDNIGSRTTGEKYLLYLQIRSLVRLQLGSNFCSTNLPLNESIIPFGKSVIGRKAEHQVSKVLENAEWHQQ